jgi:hypothetical protein
MRRFSRKLGAGLLASLVATPLFAIQRLAAVGNTAQGSAAKPVIDADGAYHVGNGVTPPMLVYSVDVEFSDAARRKKLGGTTTLGMKVGTDDLQQRTSPSLRTARPRRHWMGRPSKQYGSIASNPARIRENRCRRRPR